MTLLDRFSFGREGIEEDSPASEIRLRASISMQPTWRPLLPQTPGNQYGLIFDRS